MGTIRAISIDFDKKSLRNMNKLAKETGVEMHCFEKSLDALKYIERNDIDIAFIDDIMPVMNSSDVVNHIRTYQSNIPIVILTKPDGKEKVSEKPKKSRNVSFLRKPFKLKEFRNSLGILLEH